MKRSLVLLLPLLALLALVMPAAAQDRHTTPRKPLPYIVPDSTLLFVSLPDVRGARKQIDGWEFKKLLDLPEMKAFVQPLLDQMDERMAELEKGLKDTLGMGREQVLDLFAGQVSLALIDVDPTKLPESPDALRNGSFDPASVKLLAVVDVDRTTETFGSAFSFFQKELAKDASFEVINHQGVEITRVKPAARGDNDKPEDGDGEGESGAPRGMQGFCYCLFNQALMLTLDDTTMKSTLDLYRNPLPDGSLGQAKNYRKVRSNLPIRNELAFAFVDIQAVLAKVRIATPEDERADFDKTLDVSGFGGLKALGANAVMDNGVLRDHLFLYAPGLRKGVLQVLSLPPTDFATLRLAPLNAMSYQSLNFDAELVYVELLEAVRAARPEAYLELKESIKRQAEDGFDLDNDLFGAVGGEMAAWTWRDDAGKQQQATWIGLKSPQNFTRFLKALVKLLTSEEGGGLTIDPIDIEGIHGWVFDTPSAADGPGGMNGPNGPNGPGGNGGMPPFIREALQSFQATNVPPKMFMGVVRDALIVTSSQDEFAFLVKHPEGREQSLAQNESFQKARAQGFANPSMFYWTDLPRMIEPMHGLAKEIVEGYAAEAKTNPDAIEGIPLDFNHFPAVDDVKKLFASGAMMEARNNLDGLLIRTRGLGVAIVLAIVGSSVSSAMRPGRQIGPGNLPPPGPMAAPMPPLALPGDHSEDPNDEAPTDENNTDNGNGKDN